MNPGVWSHRRGRQIVTGFLIGWVAMVIGFVVSDPEVVDQRVMGRFFRGVGGILFCATGVAAIRYRETFAYYNMSRWPEWVPLPIAYHRCAAIIWACLCVLIGVVIFATAFIEPMAFRRD